MRPALANMLRPLKEPNYRRWATADFISVTGAWMQNLALNWLVLTMTGSAGLLGMSVLFQSIPGLLIGPWAGTIADRFPARRVLLVTQTLHALLALVLAGAAVTHAPLPVIYGTAVLSGLVTVFDGPALGRFGSQLVPRETLGSALGMGSIISSGGRILGMSLAGALVGITGEPMLFVLNALSFVGVLVALFRVRPEGVYPLARSTAQRSGVLAGIRYVLGHRPMITVFALGFVLSSLGRNYQITMAAMSEGPLGAGAAGYGVLSVVFAVGTVFGGFLAASRRELTLRILLVIAVATSVLQSLSGWSPSVVVFSMFLLPIAAGAVVIDTALGTRIQLDSDDDMRGRVLAAKGMITAGSGAVGGPILGWLSENAGPRGALEIAGVVTVAATALAWTLLARMRERRAMPAAERWQRLAPAPPIAAERTDAPDASTRDNGTPDTGDTGTPRVDTPDTTTDEQGSRAHGRSAPSKREAVAAASA